MSAEWTLTAAELRLLPMLSTHLTADEIAPRDVPVTAHHQGTGQVDLRKLDANSRSQAVARARELGLLEG